MSREKNQALMLLVLAMVFAVIAYGKEIAAIASWPSAVKSGSLAAVKLHFLLGADVNAVKSGFKTPLEESLGWQPNPGIIKEILDHKPDRAKLADKNKSLLIKAMSSLDDARLPSEQTIEILKRLIDFGEDVDFIEDVNTPLFKAVWLNRPDLVKFLLEAGAKPSIVISNSNNNMVHTIFDSLQHTKNKEIIEILFSRGTELDSEALMHAMIDAKNMEAIKMLAGNGISLNNKNPKNNTVPLMSVISSYNEDQVREFVELGADVNVADQFGRNVLATCVQYNKFELAEYFIEKGTSVNYVDKFGESLLSFFIEYQRQVKDLNELKSRIEFLALLKKSGLNINFQNPNNGQTAVMHLISRDCNFWVSMLVSMNDIKNNLQDKKGKTAMMYAVANKNEEVLEMLLLAGADRDLKDNMGKTALDYAIEMKAHKISSMLKK